MPATEVSTPEKYTYPNGFGLYHQSEALPCANPVAQHNPQVPPYKLLTECISSTSFTTPRDHNLNVWMYRVKALPARKYSSDGDYRIIPQTGVLDIHTKLGNLLVRPYEIAMVPRGVRCRVTLPAGPARGYICELHQGHFRLPDLGTLGSSGLANARDFQIPVAVFEGTVVDGVASCQAAEWTMINKYNGKLFSCTQDHMPFHVAGWHGTYYPYKYDLGRFSVIGSLLYDHPDQESSLFLVHPHFENQELPWWIFASSSSLAGYGNTYWLPTPISLKHDERVHRCNHENSRS